MKITRQTIFATALSVAAIYDIAFTQAHETRLGALVIEQAWSRQSPMAADVAAGFMRITNTGSEDDRLIAATGELANIVQLHDMKMEGGVMKMFELEDGIPVPAGRTVELKPGSLHVMFMEVKQQPAAGTMFKGTLTFAKAGTVEVSYEVKAMMSQ
jgi:hypothetical protein